MQDRIDEMLMTQPQVMQAVGYKSRTSLYRRRKAGTFPPAVDIGNGQIRWRRSDIVKWIDSLPVDRV
jgi:predicted DNA-binding transcriptional regulator AlpA